MRTERQFIRDIDCRFPYDDDRLATETIVEACAISANAAYMVLYELACAPRDAEASVSRRGELVDRLDARFEHPTKAAVIGVVRRMMKGEAIPFGECAAVMRVVGKHRDQYNALNVVLAACEEDRSEAADLLHGELVARWRRFASTDGCDVSSG